MSKSAPNQKRKHAEDKGRRSEILAAALLCLKGYQIIKWRYKCHVGEIDLIIRRGKILAFVEVKAHKTFEKAILAITATSRKRIIAAAGNFCKNNDWTLKYQWRYDAMIFVPRSFPKHMRDAFRP